MGRRRLPLKATLGLGWLAVLAVACTGDSSGEETPVPSATATTGATSTPTTPPSPSPTPDPFRTVATDPAAAARVLQAALGADATDLCPPALKAAWQADCASGDVDGDGRPDQAYLVAIAPPNGRNPNPSAVLLRRAATQAVEAVPLEGDADRGSIGRAFFALSDRTGDATLELVFLATSCGASGCASTVHVDHWDGTAWREAGPGEATDNLERVEWQGTGAASLLLVRGGLLNSLGAGPTRTVTTTHAYRDPRYEPTKLVADPPVYLYHAIVDADALFDAGKFEEAASAYRAAASNKDLKDWKAEVGRDPGRPALQGYALFRIALATAAHNADPNAALDAVVLSSKEALFVNAAQAFRKGYQERDTVHAACLAVTDYLATENIPGYVREMFDYGYGNPMQTYRDICPL